MVYTSSVRFSHCFVIVVFNRVESRANKLYFRVPPENLDWKGDDNLSQNPRHIISLLIIRRPTQGFWIFTSSYSKISNKTQRYKCFGLSLSLSFKHRLNEQKEGGKNWLWINGYKIFRSCLNIFILRESTVRRMTYSFFLSFFSILFGIFLVKYWEILLACFFLEVIMVYYFKIYNFILGTSFIKPWMMETFESLTSRSIIPPLYSLDINLSSDLPRI